MPCALTSRPRGVCMNRKNPFIEGMLSVGLLFALIFVTFYVPVVSILSIWFLPLPVMYEVSKNGLRRGLAILLAGIVFSLLLAGLIGGLVTVFFSILGFTMGLAIRFSKSVFAMLLSGSLVNCAVLILYLAVSVLLFGFNPIDAAKTAISRSVVSMLNQMGSILDQQTSGLIDFYKSQIDYLGYLAPALIVTVSFFYALIVELIHLPLLRRLHIVTPEWLPFRLWKVPKSVIWFYLAVLVVLLFGQLTEGSSLYIAVINIQFILDLLLAVQGFSFMFYFSYVKRIPAAVTIIVSVVAVIFSYLLQFVKILGIIDLGFNVRERLKKNN
ncbi:DUF2232 domain-containing protein [Sporolactobacillus sp. THM7-4]|nr:DUF2232 domain-containing protein [Sporolactobacillus sp. THM7-4]